MEVKHCVDCAHCVYRNRWTCGQGRWEFSLWSGHCEIFKDKNDAEDKGNRD